MSFTSPRKGSSSQHHMQHEGALPQLLLHTEAGEPEGARRRTPQWSGPERCLASRLKQSCMFSSQEVLSRCRVHCTQQASAPHVASRTSLRASKQPRRAQNDPSIGLRDSSSHESGPGGASPPSECRKLCSPSSIGRLITAAAKLDPLSQVLGPI